MQSYQCNTGDYMRRGNQGRNSRMSGCQQMASTPFRMSESDPLEQMALAMAYVPWQSWRNIMCPEKALRTGTIFEELNKPFLGTGGCR